MKKHILLSLILAVTFILPCKSKDKEAAFSLKVEKYTLSNGLTVVLHEDKSAQTGNSPFTDKCCIQNIYRSLINRLSLLFTDPNILFTKFYSAFALFRIIFVKVNCRLQRKLNQIIRKQL